MNSTIAENGKSLAFVLAFALLLVFEVAFVLERRNQGLITISVYSLFAILGVLTGIVHSVIHANQLAKNRGKEKPERRLKVLTPSKLLLIMLGVSGVNVCGHILGPHAPIYVMASIKWYLGSFIASLGIQRIYNRFNRNNAGLSSVE